MVVNAGRSLQTRHTVIDDIVQVQAKNKREKDKTNDDDCNDDDKAQQQIHTARELEDNTKGICDFQLLCVWVSETMYEAKVAQFTYMCVG